MNAKVYLQSIYFLDIKISSNKERVKRYKEQAENRTSKPSPDRVMASPRMQKMADAVILYSDIEREIKADEQKKKEIVDTICQLKPNESIVLYKCYVDGKSLKEVAKDIRRSYSWVSKRHLDGIESVQKVLDAKENMIKNDKE